MQLNCSYRITQITQFSHSANQSIFSADSYNVQRITCRDISVWCIINVLLFSRTKDIISLFWNRALASKALYISLNYLVKLPLSFSYHAVCIVIVFTNSKTSLFRNLLLRCVRHATNTFCVDNAMVGDNLYQTGNNFVMAFVHSAALQAMHCQRAFSHVRVISGS